MKTTMTGLMLALAIPAMAQDSAELIAMDRNGYAGGNEMVQYIIRYTSGSACKAWTVDVVATLDADFDPERVLFEGTSDPATLTEQRVDPASGQVTWRFWSNTEPVLVGDEEGYVIFSVLPRGGLAAGTELRTRAAIHFNAYTGTSPMDTNEAVTTLESDSPVASPSWGSPASSGGSGGGGGGGCHARGAAANGALALVAATLVLAWRIR